MIRAGLVCLGILIVFPGFSQQKPDALAMYRAGRFEEAIQICLNELKEMPRNMDSYSVMGWSLLRLERHDEALSQANKALRMAPFDHRIIEIAGEALFYLGRNGDALKHFEEYVSIAPAGTRIAGVYYFMGEIFIRLEQYNNADIAFSTALHYENSNADWWSRLGYVRERGEDYAWAKLAYENALKLNPALEEAEKGLESVNEKLGAP
jgi:tetratricopeptide (TPR) repeat protein